MRRSPRTLLCAVSAVTVLTGFSGCADKAVETIQQGESAACGTDQKTIEVAVDTFYASGGASGTATVDVLVGAGLLRAASTSYIVASDGITVIPLPGGPCDTSGGTGAPAAEGALSPELCEADRLTLQAAVDAFGAAYNVSPMDEPELVRAGVLAAVVRGYDLQGSTVVPAAGVCA